MITTTHVNVKTTNQTYKYYQKLGYDLKCYDIIKVKIEHLSKGSHIKVNIECDECKNEFEFEFRGISSKINNPYECKSCMSKRLIKEGIKKGFNKERNQKIANNVKMKMLDENYKNKYFEKRKKTKLEKYGDETFNNQEKKRNTCLEKYDDETFNNPSKKKMTTLKKHGDKTFNNQEKKRNTCLEKYGVYHTNQVPEIFEKIQISAYKLKEHNETKLKYRGTYEKDFLDYCYSNNILVDNFDGSIKYTDKNVYYPDFYLKDLNLIIEIKSNYTYEMDYDKNKLKELACIEKGYNFIFIIDKNYSEFDRLLIIN